MNPSIVLAGVALAGGLGSPAAVDPCAPPSAASCEAAFAAAPGLERSARCFYEAAQDPRQRAAAGGHLERLARRHPEHPWLEFYLGSLHWAEKRRAIAELGRAAGRFAARGDVWGELTARSSLARGLELLDEKGPAAAERERAVRLSRGAREPRVRAQVLSVEAGALIAANRDLARARRLLLEAQGLVPNDLPRLFDLAGVTLDLGHLDEAERLFARVAALAAASCNRYAEGAALASRVRILRERYSELPRPEGRAEVVAAARRAVAANEAAGQLEAAGKMHAVLGLYARGAESRAHFDRCAADSAAPSDRSYCEGMRARALGRVSPAAAAAAVDEAFALADQAADPWSIAYAWRERMRVAWRLGPKGRAIGDSLAALSAIEAVRDLEPAGGARADRFTSWVQQLHWLAGRLLESHRESRDPGDLELAFEVMERARARSLREALADPEAPRPPLPEELSRRRNQVFVEISRVQRRLIDPATPAAERRQGQGELERLELRDEELAEEATRAAAPARRPALAPPRLAEVRARLGRDEALLAFQIAPWQDIGGEFAGGAWVLVVTRDGARAVPLTRRLAGRTALRQAIPPFDGLLERGDDRGRLAAARLHGALLTEALAALPPAVGRLVIVPDDALSRLPFAALRAAPSAPPLVARYQLTLVPSAALWLGWRARPAPRVAKPALVLADPAPDGEAAAAVRSAALLVPRAMGALPYAREEGRRVRRHLGAGTELWLGGRASERALKRALGSRLHGFFGLYHFAAHAAADPEPERSFLRLAPGGESEDGLLQAREIAGLDLGGAVVVLSACDSGVGELLRGEGVLNLARAFFEAGATTVVATLRPLRDDQGAALFDRFYAHLEEGKSVAAALRAAQLDRAGAGAPEAAWAGVVVLGDGERVPRPAGPPVGAAIPLFALAAGAALAGALGILLALARARARRRER